MTENKKGWEREPVQERVQNQKQEQGQERVQEQDQAREQVLVDRGISPETMAAVRKFVTERDWDQFHNPKDMAISLSLEAAELLEVFQWSGTDLEVKAKRPQMAEELADVLMYCIMLSQVLELDVEEIIRAKLVKNRQKYPVEKAYGSAKKYTEL